MNHRLKEQLYSANPRPILNPQNEYLSCFFFTFSFSNLYGRSLCSKWNPVYCGGLRNNTFWSVTAVKRFMKWSPNLECVFLYVWKLNRLQFVCFFMKAVFSLSRALAMTSRLEVFYCWLDPAVRAFSPFITLHSSVLSYTHRYDSHWPTESHLT